MKTYVVTYPILGYVEMTVEAESEEAAMKAFWESVNNHDGDALKNPGFDNIEWDFVTKVVSGNVFHGTHNEAYAEELED